jgi:hypothetical protein
MATREQVVAALDARLRANVTGIKKFSRAYVDPASLQAEDQPALLLLADNYVTRIERGRPAVWTLNMAVIIYVRAKEADESPETQLNDLIDQVETALQRQASEAITDMSNPYSTTLGGLCSRCQVTGPIDLIPGEVGGQAAAMIPVEVFMP